MQSKATNGGHHLFYTIDYGPRRSVRPDCHSVWHTIKMQKLENILEAQSIKFQKLENEMVHHYQQKWRKTYAINLCKTKGIWTLRGFDWHVFSFNYAGHLSGHKAWDHYRKMCGYQYLILPNANDGAGYWCESAAPVNLLMKGFDLYICPEGMDWTFVHTHEESSFGPFYSDKSMI
ncbi:MAG: DUF4275 family protein [Desulfobacterales bacterium]|nr:DUF4275 family protein [Desulfobacterales bacterium]